MSELLLGRHYSPGGSRAIEALRAASQAEDTAIQLFAAGRLSREVSDPPDQDLDELRQRAARVWGLTHSAYTINLCAPKSSSLARVSRTHLVRALKWSERIGFRAVNFHPGSARDRDPARARESLITNCRLVLARYEGDCQLLLENSAGDARGRIVGADIHELLELSSAVGDPRCGVCVDTVHSWAAGWTLDAVVELVADSAPRSGEAGGVRAMHLNAPAPNIARGSHLDRHGTARQSVWPETALVGAIQTLARSRPEVPLVMETRATDDPQWLREQLRG